MHAETLITVEHENDRQREIADTAANQDKDKGAYDQNAKEGNTRCEMKGPERKGANTNT